MVGPISQVVLEDDRAIHNVLLGGPGGRVAFKYEVPVDKLTQCLAERGGTVLPWVVGLIPSNLPLRAIYHANQRLVFLVEYPPGRRTMSWIRDDSSQDFGPKTTYRTVTIALPYILFFITISLAGELGSSSVYFRTAPLQKNDFSDDLFECHLLNCSVDAYEVHCWVCSQHMRKTRHPNESLPEFVAATIENFWLTSNNRSSERHEGRSFFSEGSKQITDRRVKTIANWEAATAADAQFALAVPWIPAGRTAFEVFYELTKDSRGWPFRDSAQVASLITELAEPKEKRV